MAWTTRELVILGMLMMCMPAQYWLISKLGTNTPQQGLLRITRQLESFKLIWFESINWWKRFYIRTVNSLRRSIIGTVPKYYIPEECPAKEVYEYRQRTGYFGLSSDDRLYRPEYLSYRVGQVVSLSLPNYQNSVGVIISWDLYGRAPESWLEQQYSTDQELRKEPHYRILLGKPFLKEIYVAQRYLKILRATQVNNPRINEIFINFDGAQYIPKAPLKKMYPLD